MDTIITHENTETEKKIKAHSLSEKELDLNTNRQVSESELLAVTLP